jgi:ABC-type lipoprotein export system ATPase subunit
VVVTHDRGLSLKGDRRLEIRDGVLADGPLESP